MPRMRRRGAAWLAIAAPLTLGLLSQALALSPKGAVKLRVSSRGHSASRTIAVG